MGTLKKSEIKDFVKETVKVLSRISKTREDFIDGIFSEVDAWWGSHVGTGRIDQLPKAPQSERDLRYLSDAVTILQVAQEEGWGIESDSGLWEGLAPFPALMSQAFFTLEQAIGQQEPRDLR